MYNILQIVPRYVKTTFDVVHVNVKDAPKTKQKTFVFNKIFCSKLFFNIKGQNVNYKWIWTRFEVKTVNVKDAPKIETNVFRSHSE